MFDFKNLGDVTRLATQAKELQQKQDLKQDEMINLLKDVVRELKSINVALDKK